MQIGRPTVDPTAIARFEKIHGGGGGGEGGGIYRWAAHLLLGDFSSAVIAFTAVGRVRGIGR